MDHLEDNQKSASPQLIPPHGGYRDLQSYQMSEIVYDGTAAFCDGLINPRSRPHDQMAQAVRSAMIFCGVRPLGCGATEFTIKECRDYRDS